MTENHHCRIVDVKDAGFRGTGNVRQGGRGAIVRRARAMGVSVATISRGVTRLEERLGARLFNRTSRQLALTDFGLTLAERATRIYCEAEDVENAARGSRRFYRPSLGSIRRW
jgi:DNA-binding transcriptional LysR family regulator